VAGSNKFSPGGTWTSIHGGERKPHGVFQLAFESGKVGEEIPVHWPPRFQGNRIAICRFRLGELAVNCD